MTKPSAVNEIAREALKALKPPETRTEHATELERVAGQLETIAGALRWQAADLREGDR